MALSYRTTIGGHPVEVIDMNFPWTDCHICGEPTPVRWGVPVWNGFIVANDWPGEWGGVSVCRSCFKRHEAGEFVEVPTSEFELIQAAVRPGPRDGEE